MAGRKSISGRNKRKHSFKGVVVQGCLRPGDRLAVVAPSSSFQAARLRRAVDWLGQRGYEVVCRKDILSRSNYLAGSDERRLAELVGYWKDPSIRGILIARGGYGATRLLEYLSPIQVGKKPKLIMGMSDATSLLNTLARRGSSTTIYGPVVAGEQFDGMALSQRDRLFRLLEQPTPQELVARHDFEVVRPGKTSGRLWGGNLALVATLVGTPFDVSRDGGILFLEDVAEPEYRLDRMWSQLYLAGVFDRIDGLVLGEFLNSCGRHHKPTFLMGLIDRYLNRHGIPVLTGLQVGHRKMKHLLPIGGSVRIEAGGKRFLLPPLVTAA